MITIIGGSGQIGGKIARLLLHKGRAVRVIARRADQMAPLISDGAEPAIGDVKDADFLEEAISGSEALFFMIPPVFTSEDMIQDQNALGVTMTRVVERSGVRKIVNMSSVGADLDSGTGPIVVLRRQEQRFDSMPGADVLHLRAAWFMENLLYRIGGIKATGNLSYMIGPGVPMYAVATADIATVAAEALSVPDFTGKSVRYLLGRRTVTFAEMARILGAAIGMPGLEYLQVPPSRIKESLMAHGYSRNGAEMFEQTANAFNIGLLQSTVVRDSDNTTPTSLEEFAQTVFAPAYFKF